MSFSTVAAAGATAKEIWEYATRDLTRSKFPFWSAIITQVQGSVSIPATSFIAVIIQPAPGETWLAFLSCYNDFFTSSSYVIYQDFDGTTGRAHTTQFTGGQYGDCKPHLDVTKILTSTLYARFVAYNAAGSANPFYYGYSGFKLSHPLWSPQRVHNPPPLPWKKPATKPLPSALAGLERYAFDILGVDPARPMEYDLGIILEEDTVLAVDPETKFPVERFTAYVKADVLADYIAKFKAGTADPVLTGYKKYLDKWKVE